jgi:hypothetical protein
VEVKLERIDSKDASDNDLIEFCFFKLGPLWTVWNVGWTYMDYVFYDTEEEARSLFNALVEEEDWKKLVSEKRSPGGSK